MLLHVCQVYIFSISVLSESHLLFPSSSWTDLQIRRLSNKHSSLNIRITRSRQPPTHDKDIFIIYLFHPHAVGRHVFWSNTRFVGFYSPARPSIVPKLIVISFRCLYHASPLALLPCFPGNCINLPPQCSISVRINQPPNNCNKLLNRFTGRYRIDHRTLDEF